MALNKNPKANLRAKYRQFLEISFIIALALLLAAFKYFPVIDKGNEIKDIPPDIIKIVDVEHTTQHQKLPPPPRPAVIISDIPVDIITDIELPPTDLDPLADNNTIPPVDKGKKKIIEEEPFIPWAEIMPEPLYGIQELQRRIVYPELARKAGIEGKIYIMAFVDEKGDVIKAEVVKSVGAGLDAAAMTAVMDTKFKPGQQRGIPVKVKVVIPVVFRLN